MFLKACVGLEVFAGQPLQLFHYVSNYNPLLQPRNGKKGQINYKTGGSPEKIVNFALSGKNSGPSRGTKVIAGRPRSARWKVNTGW